MLRFDGHVLNRDLGQGAVASSDKKVLIWKSLDGLYAKREQVETRSDSLEDSLVQVDFQDVTGLGSSVDILIGRVNRQAAERSLDASEVALDESYLFVLWVDREDLHGASCGSAQTQVVLVEELDHRNLLVAERAAIRRLAIW